jgi:hypothetical protein
MQVKKKLSKKSSSQKELALLEALAREIGPPGSPERLFIQSKNQQSALSSRPHSEFKESPYIPKSKQK